MVKLFTSPDTLVQPNPLTRLKIPPVVPRCTPTLAATLKKKINFRKYRNVRKRKSMKKRIHYFVNQIPSLPSSNENLHPNFLEVSEESPLL